MSNSDSIELSTLVLCRELPGGQWTATPVADPSIVSYGTQAGALSDMSSFLGQWLLDKPPRVLGRYHLPPDTRLETVRVTLTREDLSRRLPRDLDVDFACVVVPEAHDAWVLVPAIDHTCYVAEGDDVAARVSKEVQRIVAAYGPERLDWRSILPADRHQLAPLSVFLEHGGEALGKRARSVRKKRIEQFRTKRAEELLESIGRRLGRSDEPPLVGRDDEHAQLDGLLKSDVATSIVLVGREASGKSALVRRWASDNRGHRVYGTSGAQLVAGMSGFGEWQARVASVLEAAEHLDAILYFDNLAELLGERPDQGGVDVAGALRPWIVGERVRVIGELTPQALDHASRRHVSLFGALHQLRVEPLDEEQTAQAIARHIDRWRKREPDQAAIDGSIAGPVVELASRYLPYSAFPGKAIRFLEELRATALAETTPVERIGLNRAYDAFSRATSIPAFLLREDRVLIAEQVIEQLRSRVVGQADAVRRVVETICVVKARLQPTGKPLASLLFVGPTGVGKTELARTLTHFLFKSEERMVRFDMSEYTGPGAARRLIAGSADEPGLLTSKVRERPFCVLLLDEIEKAHPAVHDLLLQVLGEGRLTDARGQTTYFQNAIIIMTSNLGASHARRKLGIGAVERDDDPFSEAIHQAFRPELINRLDRIIAFDPLTPEEVAEVVTIAMDRIVDRRGLAQAGVELALSEGAVATLAADGHSEAYGVRALRRHLNAEIVTPVATLMASLGNKVSGSYLWICRDDEPPCATQPQKHLMMRRKRSALRFEMYRRPASVGRRAKRGVSSVLAVRRHIEDLMSHSKAEHVREQIASIRSQLATHERKRKRKKRKRDAALIQSQQRTLHRFSSAYDAVHALQEDIRVAEQLAIGALYDGEEAAAWVDEVHDMERQFMRAFFYVLTADRERRDEITLFLYDTESGGPMAHWLGGLLEASMTRRWRIALHIPGDELQEERDAAWALDNVVEKPGAQKTVLLRVKGRAAALLLAMEVGLHRFSGFAGGLGGGQNMRHMVVEIVEFTYDIDDWTAPSLTPERPSAPSARARAKRVRELNGKSVMVDGDVEVAVADNDYWQRLEEIATAHLLRELA